MLIFAGEDWDATVELKDGTTIEWRRVRSLLIDFFRGEQINSVRREGLEFFIQFTLVKGMSTIVNLCSKKKSFGIQTKKF